MPSLALKDRRVLLAVGAAAAIAAGVAIAFALTRGGDPVTEPPPASQGGLVVETTGEEDNRLDPAAPLRCFVGGQFVGELTLAECAERNGVATGALDVGVDETGALAAAQEAGTVLTPLPPEVIESPDLEPSPAPSAPVATPAPAARPAPLADACWRYGGGGWRNIGDLPLDACVQALFAGRCEGPGRASYGRWADQTLRLVPGRVEVSGDNRSFRTLASQTDGCAIPPIR